MTGTPPFGCCLIWTVLFVLSKTDDSETNCYLAIRKDSLSQFPGKTAEIVNRNNFTTALNLRAMEQAKDYVRLFNSTPKQPLDFCQKIFVRVLAINDMMGTETEGNFVIWAPFTASAAMNYSCNDTVQASAGMVIMNGVLKLTSHSTSCLCCGHLCNGPSFDQQCQFESQSRNGKQCYSALIDRNGLITTDQLPNTAKTVEVSDDEICYMVRHFDPDVNVTNYLWGGQTYNWECGLTKRTELKNGGEMEVATCCGNLCNGPEFQPAFGASTPAAPTTVKTTTMTSTVTTTPPKTSTLPQSLEQKETMTAKAAMAITTAKSSSDGGALYPRPLSVVTLILYSLILV